MSFQGKNFKGKYSVDDGYAGGSRPHTFTIRDSDLDPSMGVEDLRGFYMGSVQDAFENSIFPSGDNETEFISWAQDVIEGIRKTESGTLPFEEEE